MARSGFSLGTMTSPAGGAGLVHPDTQFLVLMVIVEALALYALRHHIFKGAQGG